MDPWQSGFNPLKPGIMKIAICGFLLGVINFNVADHLKPRQFTRKTLFFGDKNVCRSQGCTDAAKEIRRNMDDRVEPCTDFYKFACGGFIENTILSDGTDHQDIFSIVQDDVNAKLISMLSSENEPDESKSFQLAKKLYRSCTRTTEDREIEHVKEILRKLGGWPALDGDSWDDTRFNWKRWMYEARMVGDPGNCFFSFESSLDTTGTKTVIELTEPKFVIPKDLLVWYPSSYMTDYNLFVAVAKIFGVDTVNASTELRESFFFAANLYEITLPPPGKSEESIVFNGTIYELRSTYPSVPWNEYFGNFVPPEMTLADDEIVIVRNPYYYVELEALMAITSKRLVANYAITSVIWAKMKYINGKIRNLYDVRFDSMETGRVPLSMACLKDVVTSFSHSVDAKYVREHFSEEMKTNVNEVFENIKQQLKITLQQTNSLDEETRKVALEKALAFKSKIGYDDVLLNETIVEEQYRGMKFTVHNYLGNKFNQESITLAAESNALRGTSKKIAPSKLDGLTEIKAEYDSSTTSVVISASMLRRPVYSIERPLYMNYGATGWIIAHEMTHGFDDNFIDLYDISRIVPSDWWKGSSKRVFEELANCSINQYSNFVGDKTKMYGQRTLSENLADNGGIKLAYQAYENWASKNGEERRLPGLENYSPRQMFWISAASIFCSKDTDKYIETQISTDSHTIKRYRVIGSMSNSPEFAADFECSRKLYLPSSSLMIPEKRCTVW